MMTSFVYFGGAEGAISPRGRPATRDGGMSRYSSPAKAGRWRGSTRLHHMLASTGGLPP